MILTSIDGRKKRISPILQKTLGHRVSNPLSHMVGFAFQFQSVVALAPDQVPGCQQGPGPLLLLHKILENRSLS